MMTFQTHGQRFRQRDVPDFPYLCLVESVRRARVCLVPAAQLHLLSTEPRIAMYNVEVRLSDSWACGYWGTPVVSWLTAESAIPRSGYSNHGCGSDHARCYRACAAAFCGRTPSKNSVHACVDPRQFVSALVAAGAPPPAIADARILSVANHVFSCAAVRALREPQREGSSPEPNHVQTSLSNPAVARHPPREFSARHLLLISASRGEASDQADHSLTDSEIGRRVDVEFPLAPSQTLRGWCACV